MASSSLLLEKIHKNSSDFARAGKTPYGYVYSYTAADVKGSLSKDAVGLYSIALPFTASAHILGIAKSAREIVSEEETSRSLSSLELEGDYPNYFSIFIDESNDMNARYILDPKAMEYTVDFLKTYSWEIIGNTLYVASDTILPDMDIVDSFVQNITPVAMGQPSYKVAIIKAKEVFRTYAGSLVCPLCNQKFVKGKNWLACKEGHGYLMTGSQIVDTRIDSASFEKQLAAALGRTPRFYTEVNPLEHKIISCPSCHNDMIPRNYQNTGIVIDVCTHCPYRWLDGPELNSILGAYRHE